MILSEDSGDFTGIGVSLLLTGFYQAIAWFGVVLAELLTKPQQEKVQKAAQVAAKASKMIRHFTHH